MINCAIYPRKSKANDNSDSMDAQIDMCLRYLDNKFGKGKYHVTIYDKDYGITGHSTKKRFDFQRMMEAVRNKEIKLVVIQRFDRIARNTRDFCNLYHDMEQVGCELVSVSQQIDTTTPYGKNFMYMQASMAELEWALTSERRKDVNSYSRKIGKCTLANRSIPFGYKAEIVDGIRKMVKDTDKEEMVYALFKHYSQYYNYCATARYMNDKYGLEMSNKTVYVITKNRIYLGEYRENLSFCEPYFSYEEWDAIQKKKPRIRTDMKKKSEILFGGMIVCPVCGRYLHGNKISNKRGNYRFYCCHLYKTTKQCSFAKGKAESIIERTLIENIDKYISKSVSVEMQKKKLESQTKSIEKINAEIERLNVMYQKGRIEDDYYDEQYLTLTNQKRLYEDVAKPNGNIDNLNKVFCNGWQEMYYQLDDLHKKLFWREIISKIIIDKNAEITDIIFL